MSQAKLVVYTSDYETLITTTEFEQDFIKDNFESLKYNIKDFDREEFSENGLKTFSGVHMYPTDSYHAKIIKELASKALLIESESKELCEVAQTLSYTTMFLKGLYPNQAPEFYNTHPVCVVLSGKIGLLSGAEDIDNFDEAYFKCKEFVELNKD